RQVNFLGKIN
nr:Chain P, AP2V NC-P1 SUBSTRATE PEPTIDE [unidentified]2FNT_P Chain P, NC-p1 substrate PEPTIDE [synthetic construct]